MFWTWACCNRPPSPRARFLTSRKSMSWPTRVILGPRTSRPARKPGSCPMCQSHNVDPRWQAVSSGRMSFAAQDAYICPGGHELKPIRQGWLRNMRKVDYANASACRDCSLRPRCTNNYRAVSRLENEDALDSYGRAD